MVRVACRRIAVYALRGTQQDSGDHYISAGREWLRVQRDPPPDLANVLVQQVERVIPEPPRPGMQALGDRELRSRRREHPEGMLGVAFRLAVCLVDDRDQQRTEPVAQRSDRVAVKGVAPHVPRGGVCLVLRQLTLKPRLLLARRGP